MRITLAPVFAVKSAADGRDDRCLRWRGDRRRRIITVSNDRTGSRCGAVVMNLCKCFQEEYTYNYKL